FIDEEGHILGRHQGLACYTIGQRKNLGVSFGSRMFVLAIDPETNRVVVGSNDDLFTRNVMTDSNYFTDGALRTQPFAAEVKLRSGATPAKAMFHPLERGRGKLVFEADQRAVTPGQCAVYYHGDKVLGGGIIQR
ncbi:MAG: tRNA 2-thiouridine(34) synthase MnmA, partial [Peptococcaceae bacterium]|nr:tRNA 2-thiouridine(34) synthase MnmA [Peptococcaceae bacterium]